MIYHELREQLPAENTMTIPLKSLAALALWCGMTSFAAADRSAAAVHLDVYKSPSCGCCVKWMDHLAENGMTSTSHHPEKLGEFKRELGVPVRYGSCHTGVSEAGFLFEGHVPARYIRQFLDNPPEDALGLTVPAMPVGSPGMEYRDQFMAYDVLLLKKDGSVEVYASVESYEQQFD
jgi:hypothetical protein